jgi:ribonuclease BN (tRNA processing enzyme)
MIITVLGSCANQTATREAVALFVETNDRHDGLLVDAGPGIVAALLRVGRRASDVNHIHLTHTHADHVSGLAYLIWHRHYENLGKPSPAKDMTVYGQEDTIVLGRHLLEHAYGQNAFPFKIDWRVIRPDAKFPIGRIDVAVCATCHTTPSLGLVLVSEGAKVAYSGDTLPCEAFAALASGADVLLHEGMWTEDFRGLADKAKHATAADAAKLASTAKAKQLALVHIFPSLIGSEYKLLAEASQHYSGPICIPGDGTVLIA